MAVIMNVLGCRAIWLPPGTYQNPNGFVVEIFILNGI